MSEPEDFVICKICGEEFRQINHFHLKRHDMTPEEYQCEFSRAPMISEKLRKKLSEVTIEQWKDPVFRHKHSDENHPMHGRTRSKEHKTKNSAIKIEQWKDPEYRAKHKASMLEHWKDPEARAKRSIITIEQWKDPEYRAKFSGKNHPNWQGGASFLPYCHLFNNNLKEHVRNRYGRVCLNCGKSEIENGRRLDVHHIDGNKMQGCDGQNWFLVPLCRSCNSKGLENSPFYITLFMLKDLERQSREQRINGG